VQPTDHRVWSVFVFLRNTEAARRNERAAGSWQQGLVAKVIKRMKDGLLRSVVSVAAILAILVAGGASLTGF
jgi:hypothetical protein